MYHQNRKVKKDRKIKERMKRETGPDGIKEIEDQRRLSIRHSFSQKDRQIESNARSSTARLALRVSKQAADSILKLAYSVRSFVRPSVHITRP